MNILKFSLDVEAIFSLTTLAVMPRLVCFWHEWIAKRLTFRNLINDNLTNFLDVGRQRPPLLLARLKELLKEFCDPRSSECHMRSPW